MIWIFDIAVGGEADIVSECIFMPNNPKNFFRRKFIGENMFQGYVKIKDF